MQKKRGFKSSTKQPKPSATAVSKAATVIQFKSADQVVLPTTLRVLDAFLAASYLDINSDTYHIVHNKPRVNSVAVVALHFNSIPIVPSVDADFCTPEQCTWRWHRGEVLVGSNHVFTPSLCDVGHALTITCIPPPPATASTNASPPASAIIVHTAAVQACPDRSVFHSRQILGRTTPSDDVVRLMTYNILYAKYARADRDFNRMYPYAAPGVLQEAYRMPLVALEILESQPHVVCMQEMGETICQTYFEPMLRGYVGLYAGKVGSTPEGCAIFVRTDTFDVVESDSVAFGAAVDLLPPSSPVATFLRRHPQVATATRQVPSIGQLVTLRDKRQGHVVLVANTHMFYRADANIVRLVQTVLFTAAIQAKVAKWTNAEATKVRVIVAGDLNARPTTSSISFLLDGQVGSEHEDVKLARAFRWRAEGATVDQNDGITSTTAVNEDEAAIVFTHSLTLTRAIETEFTTYLKNHEFTFQDTLDYILVDPHLFNVVQTFPLFTHEQVAVEQSLPSTVFPSDHVSLICDVQYT
ncbi:hypothetical protein DYB37_010256 [Aphanomyces astaci]|uniref:Endonuclease/exonuclease/phosphatase domain-containing protein n=1 Tax=Aphanomyces astaci TaxID=112090 RepID=A0A3R7EL81_APHAT|nr:hypothetical protein DYB35_009441 [Aphanomyces astaci]RHZ04761.1 hypothetical protein DYB37_010256 [Aphanomyces astaci]